MTKEIKLNRIKAEIEQLFPKKCLPSQRAFHTKYREVLLDFATSSLVEEYHHQQDVDLEGIEFEIRNILGLHLNNFYQENGLSVSSKVRTKKEDEIISLLMPHLKPQASEWISVETRLPEHAIWVMGYVIDSSKKYSNREQMIVFFDSPNCWLSPDGDLRESELVTHWQPLPPAPISPKTTEG